MNYLIDIDGTITEDIPNEKSERMPWATPFPGAKETINEWKRRGHTITFFTSRTEDMRRITEDWLDDCGFQYDALIMNKPRGGNYIWIDNLDVQYKHCHDPKMWETEAYICKENRCDVCKEYAICEEVDWTMGPVYNCEKCLTKTKECTNI